MLSLPMHRRGFVYACVGLAAALAGCSKPAPAKGKFAGKKLEIFVGTASKPPTELAAQTFEQQTGATIELHFGGSGKMLADMKLAGRGDLYFPGSSDYMAKARDAGLVDPATEKRVVYLIPAINVPVNSSKKITGLADLAQPGLRVGIARPDTVCVGLYGAEVLELAGLSAQVKPNIVTYAESCEKTATLIALDAVDAVLGWEVFEHWDPEHIRTIYLPKEQVPRIGYIPIAIAKSVREPVVAQAFIDFLISDEGKAIYKKWHYLTTEAEARAYTLPTTPVGGEWTLPAVWAAEAQ
ncbi:MAG TPA: molybdate ABC transporter substrate-binding protein [Kofleriaceae bacterium]|nr:molybdate ABC transporter substrate-binding protein [Kofleriaceae bacterium]